jgi:lipoate-protein ligase A
MEATSGAASAEAPRTMEIVVGDSETFGTTFERDQLMMLRCAATAQAQARVWRRAQEGLLLGRFHRANPSSCAWDSGGALSRRLSGGRVVPVGPGVVCITMAVPTVNWLDSSASALRPDQVLNRALRPLLAMLRGDGIDAFYPGRDLVTAAGTTLAHASYTVMRDGVAVVEMHVAESPAFAALESLLDRLDPEGVAGVDRRGLGATTSIEEQKTASRRDDEWAARFADAAAKAFSCRANVVAAAEAGSDAGGKTEASGLAATAAPNAALPAGLDDMPVTLAHASAARDFLLEPGPVSEGTRSVATVSMLGMVECSGALRGDRLTGVRICGDLIAPFHTLDDVAAECEGEPLRPANIRKALARAMARPRSFVLGLRELDELILRLA